MEDSGFESQHNTYTEKKKKVLKRGITPRPSQRTGEDAFWLVSSLLLSLYGHLSLARYEELSTSTVCYDHTTYRCPVRKVQMLGDHSCLGQINSCGPCYPSSHSTVSLPGTVNTENRNPFRIKMPKSGAIPYLQQNYFFRNCMQSKNV